MMRRRPFLENPGVTERNYSMNILVIDAQGGGIGRQLVLALKRRMPKSRITAVGTNSAAAGAMRKAGADGVATGENAVVVGCRTADIIVGPIGIAIADAMLGEVTPAMALAIAQSRAAKILIPFQNCGCTVVGVTESSVAQLIEQAAALVQEKAEALQK